MVEVKGEAEAVAKRVEAKGATGCVGRSTRQVR